jgi:predicted nucleic acid-binding protein
MSAHKAFIDSNVVLYLLSADEKKANRAEDVISKGVIISVQVLNEVANVSRRKLKMSWHEIHELLNGLRLVCAVKALTVETHLRGLAVAERHGVSIYDAMIIAAALEAGCSILFSEDMQDGLKIDRQLQIRNPFSSSFKLA